MLEKSCIPCPALIAIRYSSLAALVTGMATSDSNALTEARCRSFCCQRNGNSAS